MDREKQNRILDAAEARFARFGFRKTSIDEIAGDAGVGKGTVYLICSSKEDLFYQVVHREIRDYCADIAKLIDPRRPADELLAECNLRAYQYLDERPLVRDLLLGNHEEVLPLWTDRLEDLRAIGRANTVEILQIGARQGRFRADLDSERVALILQELLAASVLFAYRADRSPVERLALAATGLDLLLHGVLSRA